jgi:excisionase family DNA binding protein
MDTAISVTVREAAARSGLSERTIRNAIANGALKAIRVGRRVLVNVETLKAFLTERTPWAGDRL